MKTMGYDAREEESQKENQNKRREKRLMPLW